MGTKRKPVVAPEPVVEPAATEEAPEIQDAAVVETETVQTSEQPAEIIEAPAAEELSVDEPVAAESVAEPVEQPAPAYTNTALSNEERVLAYANSREFGPIDLKAASAEIGLTENAIRQAWDRLYDTHKVAMSTPIVAESTECSRCGAVLLANVFECYVCGELTPKGVERRQANQLAKFSQSSQEDVSL